MSCTVVENADDALQTKLDVCLFVNVNCTDYCCRCVCGGEERGGGGGGGGERGWCYVTSYSCLIKFLLISTMFQPNKKIIGEFDEMITSHLCCVVYLLRASWMKSLS